MCQSLECIATFPSFVEGILEPLISPGALKLCRSWESENVNIKNKNGLLCIFCKDYHKGKLEEMADWGRNICTSIQRTNFLYIKYLSTH